MTVKVLIIAGSTIANGFAYLPDFTVNAVREHAGLADDHPDDVQIDHIANVIALHEEEKHSTYYVLQPEKSEHFAAAEEEEVAEPKELLTLEQVAKMQPMLMYIDNVDAVKLEGFSGYIRGNDVIVQTHGMLEEEMRDPDTVVLIIDWEEELQHFEEVITSRQMIDAIEKLSETNPDLEFTTEVDDESNVYTMELFSYKKCSALDALEAISEGIESAYTKAEAEANDKRNQLIQALRDEGYAIAIMSPQELGEADPQQVEELMAERGQNAV